MAPNVQLAAAPVQRGKQLWTWDGTLVSFGGLGRFPGKHTRRKGVQPLALAPEKDKQTFAATLKEQHSFHTTRVP
jgi:hypothetical protein